MNTNILRARLFGICCALAGTAAQAQSIVGPTAPLAEHSLARLRIEGAEAAAWSVLPAERVDLVEIDGGRQLLFTAPPGTYAVLAAVVVDGRPRLLKATVALRGADAPGVNQPPPVPVEDDLERAARAYADAVPGGLREAAAQIRVGRAQTVNAVVELVAGRRETARAAFGQALDQATAGTYDAAGRIADPNRYADALERAAAAMGGPR